MDVSGGGQDRGQAIQIGAILLFAILITFLAVYQSVAVPAQNKKVEANHLDTVSRQMHHLRNGVVGIPQNPTGASVTVTLGTGYPARIIAVNPPRVRGKLQSLRTGDGNYAITISNAVATDGPTADQWDGGNQGFNTGGLEYDPQYNEFQDAPLFYYGNTVLHTEASSNVFVQTGQRLVDGQDLYLVALNGTYAESRSSSASIDLEAVSASSTSIAVESEAGGGNIGISFPSRLSAENWTSILREDGQLSDQTNGHVSSVTQDPLPDDQWNQITINLERGVTYDLTMAKVGLRQDVTEENATYLTAVRGNRTTITDEETAKLVVEARDRFNNPVSGIDVAGNIASNVAGNTGDTLAPLDGTTDANGQFSFLYKPDDAGNNAPDIPPPGNNVYTARVNVSLFDPPTDPFVGNTAGNIAMNVTVRET